MVGGRNLRLLFSTVALLSVCQGNQNSDFPVAQPPLPHFCARTKGYTQNN